MTTKQIDALILGFLVANVAVNTVTRNWAAVLGGVFVIAMVRTLSAIREMFTVQRDTWVARLGEAKADEAMKAKMVAELDAAIKAGRVSFGGDVVRETQH